jgi:hypothetical protein
MYTMIYPTNLQISILNTLYFLLHKNNKCVDLSMYIFKCSNLIGFYHFCVAHNTKKIHIDHLHACRLHNWLYSKNIFFETFFFNNEFASSHSPMTKRRAAHPHLWWGLSSPPSPATHPTPPPQVLCQHLHFTSGLARKTTRISPPY